jgi:hypothetical protein
LNPLQVGFNNMAGPWATNNVTIPEVLKTAGYRA